MKQDIERDFGNWIQLITGRGKVNNGTLHARDFLPNVVVPFSNELKKEHGDDKWSMYLEDMAKCHTGDKCAATGDSNLKKLRSDTFNENKIVRHLLPANGGPDYAAPDQLFKVVKLMAAKPLLEITNLHDDLNRRQRDSVARSLGGPFVTEAGVERGATLYHVCGAWARAWCNMPQVTLAATFIRARMVSKQQAAKALGQDQNSIFAGLKHLAEMQQSVHKCGKWLHPESDFSGGTLPMDSDGKLGPLTDEDKKLLKCNAEEAERLQRLMSPKTLFTLAEKNAPASYVIKDADEDLKRELRAKLNAYQLKQKGHRTEGNSMANLSLHPTKHNIVEYEYFERFWRIVLQKSKHWNKQKETFQKDVLQFHYVALKDHFNTLVHQKDSRVFKRIGGRGHYVEMGDYFWSIGRAAYAMEQDKDKLCRNLIGDYKKLSLNPSSRHPKVQKSRVKKMTRKARPKLAPRPAAAVAPVSEG